MNKFYERLNNLLAKNKNYVDNDGNILRNKVIEDANKFDAQLLKLLLTDEKISQTFFEDVDGVKVFDKVKFSWTINNHAFLPNSYTSFKNKIGLVDERGNFISTSNNVALVFPYKDCVLEGGQTKDDQKRAEIFYNETLARDEVDTLLDPKVFTNAKKFSADGVKDCTEILPTDNLIIKGNNLIALASLVKRFQNKIKCIYIDPPFNTGADSFNYNDRFKRSTWLTFMKNRLEFAKKLLTKDGLIFIHLDYNQSHYAKVLLDEIFGEDNFINEIIWRRKQAISFGKSKFGITNDSIFMYSKSGNYNFYPIYSLNDDNTKSYIEERFKYDDNDGRGRYMKSPLVNSLYRPNLKYIFHGINPPPNGWLYSKEKMEQMYKNGEIIIPVDSDARLYRKIYLKNYEGQVVQNIWLDIPIVNPMAKEQQDFQTQKPEALIERILKCCTVEGDIILDYHLGSGTTAAVAHKMHRQYIGVEQMNYIETVTVERLKKVIDGEQGGISKAVNWQGGGSFIYCELAKLNEKFVEEIAAASVDNLRVLAEKIINSDFISYKVEPKNFDVKEFAALSLENQKRLLIEVLDKNMLYVNYSDIDDEDFKISDADKTFTRRFYGD